MLFAKQHGCDDWLIGGGLIVETLKFVVVTEIFGGVPVMENSSIVLAGFPVVLKTAFTDVTMY